MSRVELIDQELRIDGVARVLLCASVFPFRLPREQWDERLAAVRALGYHAVDVYIPWNLHEPTPGVWDFSGDRDIAHFLALTAEHNLLVVARPGPYICSEWDGGGLPAWLSLDEGVRLRQNEPRYLAQVQRWFEQIIPLLAAHQIDRGGSVALVQIENELDFFDCDDPSGYVNALAESARRLGISVPLVACAGQGDVQRAAGDLADVAPAVNLYPDDDSRDIEALAQYYRAAVAERGQPLLVTETNRSHRTLKRLVAAGARLLGPYLQTSGWNPGYGTAVNNWGDVLGFMSHDYDFGGAIDPSGAERPDATGGRRLGHIIEALGTRLAAALPGEIGVIDGALSVSAQLAGGGTLASLTNLEARDLVVSIDGTHPWDVVVPGGSTLLLLHDLPLAMGATLLRTDAELIGLDDGPEEAIVTFAADRATSLLFTAKDPCILTCEPTVDVQIEGELIRISAPVGQVTIGVGTRSLTVVCEASALVKNEVPAAARPVAISAVAPAVTDSLWQQVSSGGPALPLEHHGIFRGAGRYETRLPAATCGVVLGGASDIVSVEVGDEQRSWFANAGTDVWVPWERSTDATTLAVETRIWGHSNFDDGRLPSLRLGSLRGLDGALAVFSAEDISEGWSVAMPEGVGSAPRPLAGLGGWMTARFPQTVSYERVVAADGAIALHSEQGHARIEVYLRGEHCGTLTPLVSTLLLGGAARGDQLRLDVTRTWGEDVGRMTLLRGVTLTDWTTSRQDDEVLRDVARSQPEITTTMPLQVRLGSPVWVPLTEPALAEPSGCNAVIRFAGANLLITAVVGGSVWGRVWVDTPRGATIKGGRGDVLLLPRERIAQGVYLLVESTSSDAGRLDAVTIGGPLDLPEEGA